MQLDEVEIKERNKKAKRNGDEGERFAKIFFVRSGISISELQNEIDYVINGNELLEVKSCSMKVANNYNKYKWRSGRFWLDREQHKKLVQQNGKYCFVVHCPDGSRLIKVLPAKILAYRKTYVWHKILSFGNYNKIRDDSNA